MSGTRSTSIRVRLALWYAVLLAILLAGSGTVVYIVHARAEYQDIDQALATSTEHFRSEIERDLAAGAQSGQPPVLAIDATEFAFDDVELSVFDAGGRLVYGTSLTDPATAPSELAGDHHGSATFTTVRVNGERFRIHAMTLEANGAVVGYIQSTASLASVDHSMSRFRALLLLVALAGVLAAAVGGFLIASRALRPIADVTETARAIALSRSFARRLDRNERQDELGELARTLNQMLASLESAHRAQRRFVDDAAHELRAPLTSILGNFEFLERARDLPESERAAVLADIRTESEHLARLVADLLALARADSGQSVVRQPVELDRVVVEAVHAVEPQADHLDLAIDTLEPVVVSGDADRLKQLAIILVENACHYTPPGGTVRVQVIAQEAEAMLIVSDTGIGMSADDLPHIFDRFYRADEARSRVIEGSGLGLAIAAWIIDAHGGTIEVTSQPGTGSRFTVRLPAVTQSSPPAPVTNRIGQDGKDDRAECGLWD
jgi:heavy metal sensor kinase